MKKQYRIHATTPLGNYQSKATALSNEEIQNLLGIFRDARNVHFDTYNGVIFLPEQIFKNSIIELIEEKE